jgi:hypothetical protein
VPAVSRTLLRAVSACAPVKAVVAVTARVPVTTVLFSVSALLSWSATLLAAHN